MGLPELRQRINALKADIDQFRPLPTDLERKIMDKFRLDWNYHSSSIEGNSLTCGETKPASYCFFSEFQYRIGSVRKLYHQYITYEECEQIASETAEKALQEIQERSTVAD